LENISPVRQEPSMTTHGEHFAVFQKQLLPGASAPPLRIYRGQPGLLAEQLAEALDNPELLAGNWELVHTFAAPAANADDAASQLRGDPTLRFEQGDVIDAGAWRILPLPAFRFA
jgi:hypothetical protein